MSAAAEPRSSSRHAFGRREGLLLALGAAALLALRLWRLDADPPLLLQSHFLSDEGWWAHNARQHALFGRWILDEHNPPLFGAPLWTLCLRAVYGLLGTGLYQTRLLSAFAGVATCLALYALVRRAGGPRPAALAALLVGLDPFSLVHHRSAFVETFMTAFVAGGFALLAGSVRRPARAALAGAVLALAVLAKLWAAGVFAGVLLWWAARAALARTDPAAAAPTRGELLGFAAGAGAVALAVLVSVAALDPGAVVDGLSVHRHRAAISNPLRNLAIFGVAIDDAGLQPPGPNGFVRGSWPLVAALALAAALALVRRRRWPRDPAALALLAWFTATAAQIVAQTYQPDRRFVGLVPPIAGIAALAWAGNGLAPPTRDELADAGRWRRLAALAVAAASLAFLARGKVLGALPGIDLAALAGPSRTATWLCASVGLALFALATPALAGAARSLARRRLPAWALAAPLAAAFLLVSLATLRDVARSATTVRDASRTLAAATQHWPEAQRRAVGDAADTLALETRLFAFLIRRWDWIPMTMNDDGWERFEPWIAIDTEPERPGFVRLPDLELCPDIDGRPRFRLSLHVREERAEDVRAAFRESRARSPLRRTAAE